MESIALLAAVELLVINSEMTDAAKRKAIRHIHRAIDIIEKDR